MGKALARDVEVTGLTADSRAVKPGFLFAALPGTKADGRDFVPQAVAAGAVAVLAPEGVQIKLPANVTLIGDANPRRRFAQMAAAFHRRQPETMVAVTGTNGKTSTASFYRQIWDRLGARAAAIGTLGVIAKGWPNAGGLTTPDPAALHRTLAELAEFGVTHACMEASSHGLDQCRLDGVQLRAAAFTNLTRDHLDYHPDMEAYATAKLRLFAELLPADAIAVVNADDALAPRLREIAEKRGQTVLNYGYRARELRLIRAAPGINGQMLTLDILGKRCEAAFPLAGAFQVHNALAALGLAVATGADPQAVLEAFEHLDGVPGRLQKVAERHNGAAVYVDYAHTPDALQTVLEALEPHAMRRVILVFGCGGDRDAGKRPQMGAIAARLADKVIVTDDNPRNESASDIRKEILAACPGAAEIPDRRLAIRTAVDMLATGDLLVVAGKGHETGQIIRGTVHPFDDAEEIRAAVAELDGGVA